MTSALNRPDLRFVLSHPAHFIALGCGSGLPSKAPGTFGTLFGWLVYLAVAPYLTPVVWAAILVAGFLIGCWACQRTGRDLGVPDHGAMVWDEIIAIWLVMAFVPSTPRSLLWQSVAFGLFRFFDIVKPRPIQRFERRFKSGRLAGFGVMGDDVIAAFYSLVTLAILLRVVEWTEAAR